MKRKAHKPYVRWRLCLECGNRCIGVLCDGCAALGLLKARFAPDPQTPSDVASKLTPLPWPKSHTGGEQLPLEGQILVWVDGLNEWRTACMCVAYDDPDFLLPLEQRRYYMVDGDREERGFNITPELIWMPLPPAPEDRANA